MKKQDALLQYSALITVLILVFAFILMQILSITKLLSAPNRKKIEVHELLKLKFTNQLVTKPIETKNRLTDNLVDRQYHLTKIEQSNYQQAKVVPNLMTFVQDIDMKKLISREANLAVRGRATQSGQLSEQISTRIQRDVGPTSNFELFANTTTDHSSGLTRRGTGSGASSEVTVAGVGGLSNSGGGIGSGGLALSGLGGSSRVTRGTNGSSTGSKIRLPVAMNGGNEAALDLHELIKWMKAHPGPIPKLVAYEMGHQADDLSSAVSFTMNGRSFSLFLSCNEIELLLRICLAEGNDFTLLKDNGIKEESNFLTIGDVVRDEGKIQSLISARRAPGDRAQSFYQIFWTWWQQQLKNI